jgi:hypothetical protein
MTEREAQDIEQPVEAPVRSESVEDIPPEPEATPDTDFDVPEERTAPPEDRR